MQTQKTETKSTNEKDRLEAAKRDFNEMMKEISPFIKKRGVGVDSSNTGWTITSEQRQRQKNRTE